MQHKRLLAVVAAAVLAALAVTAFFLLRGRNASAVQPAAAPAPQPAQEVILAGRIQAAESVKVGVPVDGSIAAFHVEVGAEVSEGELLAEIRNEQTETARQMATLELERAQQRVSNLEGLIAAARLEASRAAADAARARSELDRSQRAYQRQRLLLSEGATPRIAFEKAEKEFKVIEAESKQLSEAAAHAEERVATLQRDLDAARKLVEGSAAELEATKARIEAGQVLAPVDGIVAARRGQPGDQVNPSIEDLFVIATELSHLQVLLEPEPQVMKRIRPGQQAAIFVADMPNEALQGEVKSVEGGRVLVEFSNPSPLVRPGMTAQVRIRLS